MINQSHPLGGNLPLLEGGVWWNNCLCSVDSFWLVKGWMLVYPHCCCRTFEWNTVPVHFVCSLCMQCSTQLHSLELLRFSHWQFTGLDDHFFDNNTNTILIIACTHWSYKSTYLLVNSCKYPISLCNSSADTGQVLQLMIVVMAGVPSHSKYFRNW